MEMRCGAGHIKQRLLKVCCMILFMLLTCIYGLAQDTLKVYTVKDGKMYIWLSKKLPVAELNAFISQFDLGQIGIKRFINTGNDDSIKLSGWKIGINNTSTFTLSKPLMSFDNFNDLAERIIFTGKDQQLDARFPSVSNAVQFGYNRFRNKNPFAIKDSVVTFFLKNNLKARKVMLTGSFNKWDPDALSMTKTDSGWVALVKLSPGKYWYKFIVDGTWMTDNDNRLSENDGLGNTNSVFYYTNTVFNLNGYTNARKVFLAGSFNNWDGNELAMEKTGNGWELPIYLANGTHRYRFVVDRHWMADPNNPDRFPNEYGEYNSVITIGKPHVFRLDGYANVGKVALYGSFNNWRSDELFMKKTASGWEIPCVLGPGNYEYKYMVDGKAIADPANPPITKDDKSNSILVLQPNYTFHLKGFETAKTVFLAGDFNNWTSNSLAMKNENDEWAFTVHLSPGKHLYKFIVDGNWIIDPGNKLWEQNEHNTGNSVLWIER